MQTPHESDDSAERELERYVVEFEASVPFDEWVRTMGDLEPELRRLHARYVETGRRLRAARAGPQSAAPRVDGYTLSRPLGRGGFGVVYLASDAEGRLV